MPFVRPLLALLALSLPWPALAHGNESHPSRAGTVRKEQKPWGIAGDGAAVKRTIEVGMGDTMRFTPGSIEVRLGETVRFVWTFNRAGEFDFACLIAGHYQAGMVGRIKVVAATGGRNDGQAQKN